MFLGISGMYILPNQTEGRKKKQLNNYLNLLNSNFNLEKVIFIMFSDFIPKLWQEV